MSRREIFVLRLSMMTLPTYPLPPLLVLDLAQSPPLGYVSAYLPNSSRTSSLSVVAEGRTAEDDNTFASFTDAAASV